MDTRRISCDRKLRGDMLTEPEGMEALRKAREDSRALLRATDGVLKRVLSRDNAQFLQEAKQTGGQ